MARKLKTKPNHLTRETLRDWAAQERRAAVKGDKALELWLRWRCERDGTPFPEGRVTVEAYHKGSGGLAYVYEVKPHWYRSDERGELLGKFPIPLHAIPCKRSDLWHAAHQAGLTPDEVYSEGMGWRVNAERAAKARQTAWGHERAAA